LLSNLGFDLFAREQGENEELDDFDYMTFVNQGLYEMRSGSAAVAIEYLDQAVKNDPEDELPYIVRSKCLNK
jgi:Tfp pilus assembly protein PilF